MHFTEHRISIIILILKIYYGLMFFGGIITRSPLPLLIAVATLAALQLRAIWSIYILLIVVAYGIIINSLSLHPVPLLINLFLLYFLTRPEVRSYLNKSQLTSL